MCVPYLQGLHVVVTLLFHVVVTLLFTFSLPPNCPLALSMGGPDDYAAVLEQYNASKREYTRLKQQADRDERRGARRPPGAAGPSVAADARLYLVSRRGPGSFIVADTRRSYTVAIGTRHTCTCRQSQLPCAHIRWVLTRCLGAAASQQAGLSEAELSRVLEASTAQPISRRRADTRPPALHSETERWMLGLSTEDAWLLSQPLIEAPREEGGGGAPRRPIEEDDTCPVCMEPMDTAATDAKECLTWCHSTSRECCGRPLHRECLRIWGQHQAAGSSPTCPMCRAPIDVDERSPAQIHEAAAARERQRTLRDGLEQIALREAWRTVARRREATEAADVLGGDSRLVEAVAAHEQGVPRQPAGAPPAPPTLTNPQQTLLVPRLPQASGQARPSVEPPPTGPSAVPQPSAVQPSAFQPSWGACCALPPRTLALAGRPGAPAARSLLQPSTRRGSGEGGTPGGGGELHRGLAPVPLAVPPVPIAVQAIRVGCAAGGGVSLPPRRAVASGRLVGRSCFGHSAVGATPCGRPSI